MQSSSTDLSGIERYIAGDTAQSEFFRIFGFPSDLIRSAAVQALRKFTETDDRHSQRSAAGSVFYHTLVSLVRNALDAFDDWHASQDDDRLTSPRAYRADGLGLAFVQGLLGTGNMNSDLHLRKPLGKVTTLEIRQSHEVTQLELGEDAFTKALDARPQTLWLVIYAKDGNTVHLEVSLPAGVTEDGRITGWDKRIILDDVGMAESFVEDRNDDNDEGNDVTVAISAR